MTETTTGTILSVQAVKLGSVLDADAAVNALKITVEDPTDFDSENGGSLAINGTVYQYVSVDDDAGIITLSGTGLAAAASDGDRVDVWNTARSAVALEYRALVELPGDVDNADPMDVPIALPLVLQLPLGQREPGEGEVVVLTEQDDEWVATNLPGSAPQVGSTLIPTIETSDFLLDPTGGRILMYAVSNPTIGLDDTTPGTRTYTVPAGVTVIKREGWGGGGGGAGGNPGGGGGGGGAYACDPVVVVSPGDVISYTVPGGGVAGTGSGDGGDGGNATIGTLVAKGGKGGKIDAGSGGAGGAGGSGSTGAITQHGGHGATNGSSGGQRFSGGGGSSASPTQDGADSTTGVGAPGPGTDSGAGGNAAFDSAGFGNSQPGSNPGGGGGAGIGGGLDGSAGGPGRIRITAYNGAPLAASIAALPGTDPVNGQGYPAGVMVYPTTVTDWNTITTPGTYIGIGSAQTNSPGDTRTWVGETYGRLETGTLVQVVNRLTTVDNPEEWIRQFSVLNGWQPWHQTSGNPNWVNITAAAGFTGVSWQVCKYNGEVKIQGHVNKNSGSFSTTTTTVGTLPSSDYAPAVAVRVPCSGDGTSGAGGGVLVIAAGSTTVQIQAASGSSWGAVYTFEGWPTV